MNESIEVGINIIFGVTGIILFYYVFLQKSRIDKILSTIDGPPRFPFIGNALYFAGPPEAFGYVDGFLPNLALCGVSSIEMLCSGQEVSKSNFEEFLHKLLALCKRYGKRFAMKIGSTRFVVLCDADDIERLLCTQSNMDKGEILHILVPWLGTGLLTTNGHKWVTRRKMLTPAFHFKILGDFISVFNQHSETMVKILEAEFTNGKPFDICPFVTACTLDIICETAMGKTINAQCENETDYITAIHQLGKVLHARTISLLNQIPFMWKFSALGREETKLLKILHGFTEKVISERKSELYSSSNVNQLEKEPFSTNKNFEKDNASVGIKRRLAFMDLLLETQRNGEKNNKIVLTDKDIREETDTFMFAGHDTTAASSSFTIFLLGCYPEVQTKAQEELDRIFGDDRDRPITLEDLRQMKYLECCLKESLRLYPSVALIERAITTNVELGDGTIIPAGASTLIFIYQLHRDAKYFPQPEEFNPERFLLENSDSRSPFAYLPFSAGPRNCIGQKFAMLEEKVIIANVLRKFNILSVDKQENLTIIPQLVTRSVNGLKIKLTFRT